MDSISEQRIKLLHPKNRDEAMQILAEIETALKGRAVCRIARSLSTWAEQDKLYAQGRTAPGPVVTNARGGESWHNYGMAVDVVLIIDGKVASYEFDKDFDDDGMADWREIDTVFKKYGWDGLYHADGKRWDLPHFQKTHGLKIKQAQALYNSKQFIEGTQYIKF